MKNTVEISYQRKEATIDGILVLTVAGAGHRYYWNSSIWRRSGRKSFSSPEEAFAAGIKALRLH